MTLSVKWKEKHFSQKHHIPLLIKNASWKKTEYSW